MIVALWAEEKCHKTTMGLSFPKPLYHLDLDVGGYERAAWRISTKDITSKSYPIPVQIEKLMGLQSVGTGKATTVRFPRRVIGYKEVWQQIVVDFVAMCQDSKVSTVFVDSATQLWSICHTSLLQEKQEVQIAAGVQPDNKDFRERLQPVEFPNDRIRSLIYTARSYGKNLVLSHYPRDVYAERLDSEGRKQEYRTGELTLDGFKDTQKLVDIVIHLTMERKTNPVSHQATQQVIATITRCGLPGLGTTAVGMEIETSYQGIVDLQERMKAMQGG